MNLRSQIANSADGVPIHYDVQGNGATALVFAHGWCCNRHYWKGQVNYFAPHYTVVCIDLAGHGASGHGRDHWNVPAFGEDVVAVVQQLGLEQVVLVGHSMSGAVIVEAARRLPVSKVAGLVGVDTWQNVQKIRTPEQIAESVVPFQANFVETTRAFVRNMFAPTADAALVEKVVRGMSAMPPHIGTSVFEEFRKHARMHQAGLLEVKAPKITINSAWLETDTQAAQHYGIEVVLMPGVGHFLMLEAPQAFNALLDEAVKKVIQRRTP